MLYHHSASEFDRAAPLFRGEPFHLAVASALARESPAEMFVDDPQQPHMALLILWNDRIYLAGEPDNTVSSQSCAALLLERYAPSTAADAPRELPITYAPPAWEERLPNMFAAITSFRAEREYYRLDLPAVTSTPPVPNGFRLRRVDEALVSDSSLGNHSDLLDEMCSEAPSVADFLAGRFGFCMQHEDALVAWCLSEYNHGIHCEVGIATLPALQRRGLATAVAQALIAHAQSQGITSIGWDCWKRNLPSGALARKLGFAKIAEYPVWYCQFGQSLTNP